MSSDNRRRAALLRSRIDLLRSRFIERAADDEIQIAEALQHTDRAKLRERAHRLAGIAATFGYAEIGDQAACVQAATDKAVPDAELAAATKRLIALLEACRASGH